MTTNYRLDMTMMYAFHDALRRDLASVTKMTARSDGWDTFERFLRAHHLAEDETLWPTVRQAVAENADDLALLEAMAAEHDQLDPLLNTINAALNQGQSVPSARAELAARLQDHLLHEETSALALIDRTLDAEQWMRFGDAAAAKVRDDMRTFLPWLLNDAHPDRTDKVLAALPAPVRQKYRTQWQAAYTARDWWAT
jgi:Hemerythrin HHE cation binding domain